MDKKTDLNTNYETIYKLKDSTNETIINIDTNNHTDFINNTNILSSNEPTTGFSPSEKNNLKKSSLNNTLNTKETDNVDAAMLSDGTYQSFNLGKILRLPYFVSTFDKNKIFNDCVNELEYTPGPLVVEYGKIMQNTKNVKLTHSFPCCVLVWDGKSGFSLGQGFYYGSNLIMTAKHVLKNHKSSRIFVIFPDYFVSAIFKGRKTLPEAHNRVVQNYDIAFIELEGNLDLLQNQELPIGELSENEDLYFYPIESGCFSKKLCRIKQPNSDIKKKMLENEFILSDAGEDGDSGTPIYSRSGTCVGLYIGAYTGQNSTLEYGRALQFDREVLNKLKNITLSVPKPLILFSCLIIFVFLYIILFVLQKHDNKNIKYYYY